MKWQSGRLGEHRAQGLDCSDRESRPGSLFAAAVMAVPVAGFRRGLRERAGVGASLLANEMVRRFVLRGDRSIRHHGRWWKNDRAKKSRRSGI